MADRLRGKVALVTGASSGIGEATALALAREGVRLAINARRQDRLLELVQRIERDFKGEALPIVADVADEAEDNRMVAQVMDHFGRLDILINNAGVMLLGPILDANTEDWRRMVNLNLLGLMYVTHAALPILLAQGGGDIVNISSVAGRTARVGSGVYNATKWGVSAFSESLRQEVTARHVRITLIEPGAVATELVSHITHEHTREQMRQFYESVNPLQAEDVADAILFALRQPPYASINEVLMRPTEQER